MNQPLDLKAKAKQDVVRMLKGIEKDLGNAPLETLRTIFRCLHYLRTCLKTGKAPREHT